MLTYYVRPEMTNRFFRSRAIIGIACAAIVIFLIVCLTQQHFMVCLRHHNLKPQLKDYLYYLAHNYNYLTTWKC